VSVTVNKEEEFFDLYFAKQIDQAKAGGELILAYDGVLNTETISKLETEIEGKIMEKGYPKAQRHLADCYMNGFGCNKSYDIAKHWYSLAAEGKDSVAKKKIENWEWHAQF